MVWKRVKSGPRSARVDAHERRRSLFRVEQDLCELFMSKHFPEDHTGVECNLFVAVSSESGKDDFLMSCTNILDSGQTSADLTAQKVVEYLHDVFPGLEIEACDVLDEDEEQVGGIGLLGELCDQFRDGFCGWDMSCGEGERRKGGRTAVTIEDTLDGLEIPGHFFARLRRAIG